MKKLTILICLILSGTLNSYAQNLTDSINVPPQNFFRRSGKDLKYMGLSIWETYKRPFSWKKKEWLTFGTVMGGSTLIAVTLDEPVYDYFKDRQTEAMNKFTEIGFILGEPNVNYPIMFGMWGAGAIFNNDWMRQTGGMMIASVTASGLIQTFAKTAFGRARPSTGDGALSFKPFDGTPQYHSLPSGHTSLAFALHWVLARQVNWLPAKIVFYSIPVIVAISRIHDGAHWMSDVVLGGALGIAMAETVLRVYPKLQQKDQGLAFGPTQSGFGFVYKF